MHISNLQRDPLFASELCDLQVSMRNVLVTGRDVMERIQDTADQALSVCQTAMTGVMDAPVITDPDRQVAVPVRERIKCAWDLLDRAGFKPVERRVEAKADITEMIKEAYQKNKQRRESAVGTEGPNAELAKHDAASQNITMQQQSDNMWAEGPKQLRDAAPQQLSLFEHKRECEYECEDTDVEEFAGPSMSFTPPQQRVTEGGPTWNLPREAVQRVCEDAQNAD